jgi:putative peptide maturation system protein
MNDSMQQAAFEALDYLMDLQREGVRPREARARLQPLRECHPGLQIDLLAEEEAFDGSVHYDALVRRAGEGTISLSWCPERAMPWPLRGVHRWSEGDLARVNGNILQVDAAIACLDFIWDEMHIIERLVDMCIMQEELDREPMQLTDTELQQAMDQFRSAKKLFTAEETHRWLERHGMSHEKLEHYVTEIAIVPKLRDRIAQGRVEEYFSQHAADFDIARIARLELAEECQARELAGQIRAGAQDFFAAAERLFLGAPDRSASPQASLFATMERREAEPALRDQLFAAAPGQLIGPVRVETGHALMRVLEIIPAQLDGRTSTSIKDILLREWLAERRQAARIEWCWGNASKTATQA